MSRRIWAGVGAGVLAAAVLLMVGIGAYNAGQDDRDDAVVTRTIEEGDGEVVRVVDDRDWDHGPGPGFFLFPLLLIGGALLLFGRRRHWGPPPWARHGYYGHGHGYYGHGYGSGPGPCGPGPGPDDRPEPGESREAKDPSPADQA